MVDGMNYDAKIDSDEALAGHIDSGPDDLSEAGESAVTRRMVVIGALILLVLLLPERRIGWLWVAFAVVFTLNLLAAIPPTPGIAELLPVAGVLGVVGSLAMVGITLWLLADMRTAHDPDAGSTAST